MTLNTTYSPTVADGNGVTKSFSYSFNPISENYLKVSLEQNGSWVEQVSGWTATVSENGGVVTFDTAPTTRVAIERDVPEEQPTSYKTSSGFQAQVIEHSFDMLTGMVQELKEKSDRSIAVDVGSSVNPDDVVHQVERVYSSIDNIDDVADDLTNIDTVAGDLTNIDTVAGDKANIDAIAPNISKVNSVANSMSAVNTVATNVAAVNAVANIRNQVITVAANSAAINAVNNNKTNIDIVANNKNDVNTVANNISSVVNVGYNINHISRVDANKDNIDTVADDITNVNRVGGSINNVNSVAAGLDNISDVLDNMTNIDTVAGSITNVNLVGADISKVAGVADDLTNIDAVNANKTNIDKVASIKDDVTAVASIKGDVMAVAADAATITAVNANKTNIDAVATDKVNVDSVANNINSVNVVADKITNVNTVATNIGAVNTAANNINAINDAPTYAAQAKQWAIGVPGEPSGGSAKYWAERAEDAASGMENPANRDLSNLTATGQMIIDSQNGTISNCVLDIPQLLKLELSDNVITHKAGSIQTQCGDIYATYTVTQDRSTTISNSLADGLYFVNPSNNGTLTITAQEKFGSGSSLPADGSIYERFFLTTDKKMYHYGAGTWSISGLNYPVCMIKMTSGVASFAKDLNNNYMVFNGACFVGHHAVIYPNVKVLRPNEFNSDGSFRSINTTLNSLLIFEMGSTSNAITINGTTTGSTRKYFEVENLDTSLQGFQYVKSENVDYFWNGAEYVKRYETKVIDFSVTGTTVNSFAIRQPVRLATTEMLDKVQDQVNTNTTAIDGKLDKVTETSGTMQLYAKNTDGSQYMINAAQQPAVNSVARRTNTGTLAVATPTADDDATNKSYVDSLADTQNGTISNCVLEIPQNIKLELSNNVLTLKAGSVLTKTGSAYATANVSSDISKTISDGRYVVFSNTTTISAINITAIGSGSELPEEHGSYYYFYNTTDKLIYHWVSSGWSSGFGYYPICVIEVSNGVASFAKDSNGNDMIFNGAGFIGHHAFVYPNVKALIPDGFNDDGSMKSISVTRSALTIREIAGNQYFSIGSATAINPRPSYFEVNTLDDLYAKNLQGFYYVKSLNQCYSWGGGSGVLYAGNCVFIHVNISGEIVTDFTIRQPVRTATVEMLKDKQNDLTTVSGYDATTTQVLKHVNGVLTWITEE